MQTGSGGSAVTPLLCVLTHSSRTKVSAHPVRATCQRPTARPHRSLATTCLHVTDDTQARERLPSSLSYKAMELGTNHAGSLAPNLSSRSPCHAGLLKVREAIQTSEIDHDSADASTVWHTKGPCLIFDKYTTQTETNLEILK